MKIISVLLFITVTLSCGSKRHTSHNLAILQYLNDSLIIDVRNINNNAAQTTTIYVLDASLDKKVSKLETELKNRKSSTNYRIIGIGHSKYSGQKKRKDFAPPNDTSFFGADARFYGEADKFLRLVQDSIISQYDSKTDKRVLVGHSFGGLFEVYVSTLTHQPFDEIYALSPSIWVNHRSFAKHYTTSESLHIKTPLHISFGSLEQLNLVGPSIKNWQSNLKTKDKLLVHIRSIKGKTHISIIKEIAKLPL